MPVYVRNHILRTACGAAAYTAQAKFVEAKSRAEAEVLSQEFDAFIEANTVLGLIGNPLMSDLSLRLCALCVLGNREVEDPCQWFSDSPDEKWGANKVSMTIALMKKSGGIQAVDNLIDKVLGIRVHCDAIHNGNVQPPQEPPSRVGCGRFGIQKLLSV